MVAEPNSTSRAPLMGSFALTAWRHEMGAPLLLGLSRPEQVTQGSIGAGSGVEGRARELGGPFKQAVVGLSLPTTAVGLLLAD